MKQEVEKQKQQSIEISQLVDKQHKEITIEKAEVMKDQERVELEITIEKAKVMKDQEV